jgi:predicted secreted hydrolase
MSSTMAKRWWVSLLLLVVLIGGGWIGLDWLLEQPSPPMEATVPLDGLQDIAGTFPEPSSRSLIWPDDHAAHTDQFAEYWLLAGVLETLAGDRYGFQLALFRLNLSAEPVARDSAWASVRIYRGHLLISDATAGRMQAEERYARDALGLSGSSADPPRVWLEDWRIAFDDTGIRLRASVDDQALNVRIAPEDGDPVPITGPGYRGYWHPGLRVSGKLGRDGQVHAVNGEAMLDRLWGRNLPVGRGQLALSRLWLQWSGQALRCRQLRRRDGGGTPIGECLLRRADGGIERFERRRMDWRPRDAEWAAPDTPYPLQWSLKLGGGNPDTPVVSLVIEPWFEAQAPNFALPLWSGIVQPAGQPGWGLLELSNFAEP